MLLMKRLQQKGRDNLSFILTTMTIHGRDYAREKLPQSVDCFLAPLDVPGIVDRVIKVIAPDLYICIETELWPLVISKNYRRNTPCLLLNGRISDQSVRTYQRFHQLFGPVLRSFSEIGAISEVDQERFLLLGAMPEWVVVTGNIKQDVLLPDNPEKITRRYRDQLQLTDRAEVFIAGSTHEPEEKLLLPIYRRMSSDYHQVWMIAPRHLDRLEVIEEELRKESIPYDLLSYCLENGRRSTSLILVDTFGDLADLYSLSTSVFIGGSLTDYGGHNLLEAALWGNIVFFGPHIQDFQETADLLRKCGGGICVGSPEELEQHLVTFAQDKTLLSLHRARAAEAIIGLDRPGDVQVEIIERHL